MLWIHFEECFQTVCDLYLYFIFIITLQILGRNLWDPKDVETILRDYGIIILEREGANPNKTLSAIPNISEYLDNAYIIRDPAFPNAISSTLLRDTLKHGHSIRYCTPDPVVDYIEKNNLYRSTTKN